MLLNKIKTTGTIPEFLNVVNISAIYKGKGEFTNLESERGIFIVNIVRYIFMKMIYADKYDVIDKSMSDSNIGARKKKNIRNHIFVVNSVLHDVLSSSSKEPIDIMVLDKCLTLSVCTSASMTCMRLGWLMTIFLFCMKQIEKHM